MIKPRNIKFFIPVCYLIFSALFVFGQNNAENYSKSQELSESDGIPVIVKHLPEWENIRNRASFITNSEELKKALGDRPVFDLIDFTGGTEAVTAPYDQGKLLIVEFTSPQSSVDTDNEINQRLAELGGNPQIFYRRIGNYNAFLFDGTDEASANALFDQIKYEKIVQWLGEDPTIYDRAQRFFAQRTSEIFLSTVYFILIGLGSAITLGIIGGFFYFRRREQRLAGMQAFSDAGGMTRLNLDGFTEEIAANRLLKE